MLKKYFVFGNKGEKYWNKCYGGQERYRGSEIEVEKMMGKVP